MHMISKPQLWAVTAVALLAVVVLLIQWPSPALPRSGELSESEIIALMNRTYHGPIPNPVPITIQPRRLAALGAGVFAGLLLMLYAYRRRRYILDWVFAWNLIAIGLYVISRGYSGLNPARFGILVLEFSTLGMALFFYRSGHSFNQTLPYSSRYWRYWMVLPAVAAWLVISHDRLPPTAVLGPAYFIAGIALARAALIYGALFYKRRLLGALLMSIKFTVFSGTYISLGIAFGAIAASDRVVMAIFFANGFSSLVAALGMHLLAFEDMTYELRVANRELEAAQEELRRLATIDTLTGCYNRRFFEESIGHELQRHRRYRTPLSLIFADIDHFKTINDLYGHDVGDRVLKFAAEFLTRHVREADFVVRWGGDEFLLVMTCTGAEAAAKVTVLKNDFGDQLAAESLPRNLRLSLGYAEIPPDATDILPLIREADLSMYADKSADHV